MRAWLLMGVMVMSSVVAAFDPPVAKVGDFTLRIDAPQLVTQLETPIPVRIHLSNAGSQTLRGKVRLQVIDRWRITSPNPQSFELTPKSERVLEFTVIAGEGTHNAHYPIHAFAEWGKGQGTGGMEKAHAVLVVEVRAPRKPKTPKEKVVRLAERGSVPLWQQGNHQVSFQVFGQPVQTMPIGWWGTDETTGAHATLQRVDRGGVKEAIAIHPPWRKGAGTIFVDWQVLLPNTKPILLDFAFAIRDHDPQREPPSDGVTVRVWVKREANERRDEARRRKSSAIVTNPIQSGQIGKAMLSQEAKQLSVRRPVSRTDFLSDDQVKGIVVTDAPTQRSLKNFFSLPIGVQDDFDLLLSHPLANSLRFSMLCKMPLPLKATRVFHHCLNSSSLIAPARSASNIRATSFLASSNSASNSLSSGCGFPFNFAISSHLWQQLWREGLTAVVTDPADGWVSQLSVSFQEVVKASVCRPENGVQFVSQNEVNGVVVTASLYCCHCPDLFWRPIAIVPVHESIGEGKQVHEPSIGFFGANGARFISVKSLSGHGFPQRSPNFICPSVWDMGLHQSCSDVSEQLQGTQPFLRRFSCQRHSKNADRSVNHIHGSSPHPLAFALYCERASNAASINSRLATPQRSIRFNHHSHAASGPFVSFNSRSFRATYSRSFRNLATFASKEVRFEEPFVFAMFVHPPSSLRRFEIPNPTDLRQVGELLPLQVTQQLFVRRPVSPADSLSDDQVKGIVVTDSPAQRCSKNFARLPINASAVNGHFRQEFLKGEERLGSDWSPFSQRLNQTAQNFIFKPVRNMGTNFAAQNVGNQSTCWQPNFQRFVQEYDRQKHRSIYDDDFLRAVLLSHPLANSLCLRKLLKMPFPLTPKRARNHAINSSRGTSPSRNFRTISRNSLTTSASVLGGTGFRLAIFTHLAPQFGRPSLFTASLSRPRQTLCHPVAFDGGGAPARNGDDGWQLLYERHSDSKVWVPARVDLSDFAGQRITLRIEVHPGPKNDTTCDLAYIGEPYLVAGRTPPAEMTKAEGNQRLRLTAWARWQMAEAALQWKLLPTDKETREQLAALRRLLPTAATDDDFRQVDAIAQRLLKRLSLDRLKSLSQSLLAPRPSPLAPSIWVVANDGELYAFALQPPKEGGWWQALGAIVFAERAIFFDGFIVRVLGDDLSDWRSPSVLLKRNEKVEGKRLIATHQLERNGTLYTLTMLAWSEGGTLKVRWQLSTTAPQDKHQPLRITDCAIRSWSEIAERIYIGHGNVIVRPQAFRLHADGHRLSTRHAGMDFANGISVVVGVDNPPDFFECQPTMRHYSIHAHMDTTFTIAASAQNVWVAAKRYREVDPYKPAPTLEKLAGRFVFDLWGGWRYAWVAEQLEKTFRYGCTDALVIYHNWQRWGYDYRLPDIFPPNPQFGTLEDFVKMVEVCNRYGVLFAPHDNYIDFYPDAEGYSYRHICFTPDGNPVRAWFNEWRQAQSYRWRPDAFFPFMERNLKLIAEHIKPTAYFVDVFSSIGMFDWWTEDGEFHSILETQRRWGEAFNFIRKILGNAPQTSESGCDWLIGWLDGATTNHLRVDPNAPPGQWAVWRIQCEDAERIPWFDFAHHHKFALHGAGYSNRYQGGLPYEVAGIYSDDYICTEVLTGHPAMVSEPFGPQVVRKYWLLAELGRALALAKMSSVEFADGDIHRQIVRWQLAPRSQSRVPAEAIVWVNRSESDWKVNNHLLPPFGFYALVHSRPSNRQSPVANRSLEVAIEKLPTVDGERVIAEWALSEQFAYCNARTQVLFGWTPIQLISAQVRWLGNRRFELELRWRADRPTSEPHHVFVHFVNPKSKRGEQIAFQGDHAPDVPTTQWQGEIVTRTVVTVPQDWGADRYSVRVGLWNPKTGYRIRLMGDTDDTLRVIVGDLILEGSGNQITGVRLELNPNLTKLPEWLKRWNTQGKLVDFSFAVTDGAFRFDRRNLTLIPLPDHQPFTVTLRLDKLLGTAKRITAVEALDEMGKVIGSVPFTQRNGEVTFKTQAGVFAYRLR
jgi:hypothetical protein